MPDTFPELRDRNQSQLKTPKQVLMPIIARDTLTDILDTQFLERGQATNARQIDQYATQIKYDVLNTVHSSFEYTVTNILIFHRRCHQTLEIYDKIQSNIKFMLALERTSYKSNPALRKRAIPYKQTGLPAEGIPRTRNVDKHLSRAMAANKEAWISSESATSSRT